MVWKRLNRNAVIESLSFAKSMVSDKGYVHSVRHGGSHRRGKQEKFLDTFQGKLSECAFYGLGKIHNIELDKPDFTIGGKGYVDKGDFIIGDKHISIKSGRPNAQYLLLEVKSFDKNGLETIFNPPIKNDVFCFLKIGWYSHIDSKIVSLNKIPEHIFDKENFVDNIYVCYTGFLSFDKFYTAIQNIINGNNKHFIKKGDPIGRSGITMDADNYIFHINTLENIDNIWYHLEILKDKN